MKISLKWLKDYVPVNVPPAALAHKLTMAGLEVEKVSMEKGGKVFEFEITPNRPDCLSMLGVAREVSAVLGKPRKKISARKIRRPKKGCPIEVKDTKGCSRYIGAVVENVKVKRTDTTIAGRLRSIGMRSINNIVDITNFCLMETGQPLHAFDRDKLIGGKIIVRRAKKGETITTIDDEKHKLDPSVLVIADAKRPVAIAGVMGGKDTEVSNTTKNILLESAYFDPVLVRRASRKLGISSDSSYRFERGVDYNSVLCGADRALALILKSAGGSVTHFTDKKSTGKGRPARPIAVSRSWVNNYLGAALTAAHIKKILTLLDFSVKLSRDNFMVTPPSFRGDVTQAVDVVEEIARIAGYDRLNSRLPQVKASKITDDPRIAARQRVRQSALAQGLNEIISYTMISKNDLSLTKQSGLDNVAVLNPLSQEQEIMRPTMLPSFLSIARSNINRGQKDLKIFEVGKVYSKHGERDVMGFLMTGSRTDRWIETDDQRPGIKDTVNYYDLKGAIEQILCRTGVKNANIRFEPQSEAYFEAGQGARITVHGKVAGAIGKVNDIVLNQWSIKQDGIYFAQCDLESVYKGASTIRKYRPVSEYPSISRDISLAVNTDTMTLDIHDSFYRSAKVSEHVALSDVKFIELYKGKKIPKGHRGLIFSLTYRSKLGRTLRDEEVEEVHSVVCRKIIEEFGALKR